MDDKRISCDTSKYQIESNTNLVLFSFLIFLTLFTASVIANPLNTQRYPLNASDGDVTITVSPVPAWITEQVAPQAASQDSSVSYLLVDQVHNISLETPQYYFHSSSRVNNAQGLEEASQIQFSFYPGYEQLHWHFVRIIRDGNVIDKLKPEEIKLFQQEEELANKMYDARWTAMLVLDDVRVGDVIEYSTTLEGDNPIFAAHRFGYRRLNYGVDVQRTHFSLIASPEQTIHFKEHNVNTLYSESLKRLPVQKQVLDSGLQQWSLTLDKIPALFYEDQVPAWIEPSTVIEYSDFASWKDVVDWAIPLYADKYDLPVDLQQKVVAWKVLTDDKTVLISKAIEYVQKDIRYWGIETGVNSHLPSFPGVTAERRYGDCKDKTVLMTALLRALDIEAYPFLVSSKVTAGVKKRLPSPGAFDHVITTFFLDGQQYWVDGTNDAQGANLLSLNHPDYKLGLMVKRGNNQLTRMSAPVETQTLNNVETVHHYSIDEKQQQVTMAIETQYFGGAAESMRYYLATNSKEQVSNNSLQFYSRFYAHIAAAPGWHSDDDLVNNQVTVTERYVIKNMSTKGAGRSEYYFYQPEMHEYVFLPDVRERHYPFYQRFPLSFTATMKVTDSQGREPVWSASGQFKVDSAHFLFTNKVTKSGNEVKAVMKWDSRAESIPAKDFDQYQKDVNTVLNNAGFTLWMKPAVKKSGGKKMNDFLKRLKEKRNGE